MADDRVTTSHTRGVDATLLAACAQLKAHEVRAQQRFAEWSRLHPGKDLPEREQAAICRRSVALERAVRDIPARTLAGARAKAAAALVPEYWSGDRPSTIVDALLRDLVGAAA